MSMRALSLLCAGVLLASCGTSVGDDGPDGASVPDAGDACTEVSCDPGYSCFAGACVPTSGCVDADGDGFGEGCAAGEDCDDSSALINPAREEVCDERDNNCDFYVDEDNVCSACTPLCAAGERLCSGTAVVVCDDSLRCPRFGDPQPCGFNQACREGACVELCVDEDGDGVPVECPDVLEDCDDVRADVYPGGPERCDGIDNNCDRRVDENNVCAVECDDECAPGARECTGDGRGRVLCERGPSGCLQWSGVVSCGAGRSCSEGTCVDEVVCVDVDGDGAGAGCARPDCRGADPASHPAATERCDGVDNNCNGVVDDGGVCSTCAAATLASPAVARPGAPLYRVGCGGAEYVRIEGAGTGSYAVVVHAPPTATVELGTLGSGGFTGAQALTRFGGAWVHVGSVPVPSMGVRVTVRTGESFAVSVAAAGACAPDPAVPDNSPGSATALGAGVHVGSAGLCANDFDFYAVDVAPGQILDATIASPEGGQVTLGIWRNGVEVVPSFGLEGPSGLPVARRSHFRVDEPGRYVLGVRGLTTTPNNYAYSFAARPAPACTDDGGDPAGAAHDDTVGTARAGTPSGTMRGTLCPGDYDVISLGPLGAGSTLGGSFTPSTAELQVTLLRGSWSAPRDFPSGISANDDYFLVVYGVASEATGTWSITTTNR